MFPKKKKRKGSARKQNREEGISNRPHRDIELKRGSNAHREEHLPWRGNTKETMEWEEHKRKGKRERQRNRTKKRKGIAQKQKRGDAISSRLRGDMEMKRGSDPQREIDIPWRGTTNEIVRTKKKRQERTAKESR